MHQVPDILDSVASTYRRDIFALALKDSREVILPRVLPPFEVGAQTPEGVALGVGCGDNRRGGPGYRCPTRGCNRLPGHIRDGILGI